MAAEQVLATYADPQSMLLELLRQRTGLDPRCAAAQQLLARLPHAGRDGREYLAGMLAQAQQSVVAFDELVELAVVGETWFFRDPAAFEALADAARQRPPGPARFRVLCAPCSSGEEAYSIAATLQRAGLRPHEYEILAFDIAEAALACARRGVYGAGAFRGTDPARGADLVAPDGSNWRVRDGFRESLRFSRANLLELDPASLGGPFDVVFCRNLLIYFDDPSRNRAWRLLRALATPDTGLLFVGPAEAPGAFGGALEALPLARSFGFHNRARTSHREHAPPARAPFAATSATVSARPARAASTALQRASAIPRELPMAADLDAVRALADRGDLAAAWDLAQMLATNRTLDADLHAMLGLLAEARQDTAMAQRCFQKALFLEPDHVQSLRHLLLMAQASGAAGDIRRLGDRLTRACAAIGDTGP